ncbi:unnamed protein product [Polarella glacialis]|uniref:Uncharacterized protein n=1 Tax=Polarella glacialis TaxID=89957 RepID=A0A813FGC3_POLGL|nr:unnamed protein product [Polarella glacialis]CAE8681932.1 unnamed protein product [Polarella glacialis]
MAPKSALSRLVSAKSPWRTSCLSMVYVHQMLILNLLVLSFVGISSLLDPDSMVKTVQQGEGGQQTVEAGSIVVSRLQRDLARSTSPAGLAIAFVCAQGLWKSLEGKRDALTVLTLFHASNLLVLAAPFWEQYQRQRLEAGGPADGPTLDEQAAASLGATSDVLPKAAMLNLVVGAVAVAAHLGAVLACKSAMASVAALSAPAAPPQAALAQAPESSTSSGEVGSGGKNGKSGAGADAGKKKK